MAAISKVCIIYLGVTFETYDRSSRAVYVTKSTVTPIHASKTLNNYFEIVCQERLKFLAVKHELLSDSYPNSNWHINALLFLQFFLRVISQHSWPQTVSG